MTACTDHGIAGLQYRPGYVSRQEQEHLLAVVDTQPWLPDLRRRVQHYGYRYDYRAHRVGPSDYLGPLPQWAGDLAHRLYADGLAPRTPDQVIVNEYEPGQGIAEHVDCLPCFGDTIISVSLGSPCVMTLTPLSARLRVPILLEPGSVLVLQGEARTSWKHGIPARMRDDFDGRLIERARRVSLTFRSVIVGTA